MGCAFLWWFAWICFLRGGKRLLPGIRKICSNFSERRKIAALRAAAAQVRLLQEILESGMIPDEEAWREMEHFPAPWNRILGSSIRELRSRGSPLLPTLRRFRAALLEQVEWILEAGVRSAQALSQAVLSVALIPLFGMVLYSLLPGVKEAMREFLLLVFFSMMLSSIAYLWILNLADRARFGGLPRERRQWWISIHAVLERIFALISAGEPPDQAWRTAIEELFVADPELARVWGAQIWDPCDGSAFEAGSESERLISGLGRDLRRAIQVSLVEGRGCMERLESIRSAAFLELKSRVQRELSLLPNACLKPLFLFVFPGVMFLLAGSLWISLREGGWE
jgi:hypothetical protein